MGYVLMNTSGDVVYYTFLTETHAVERVTDISEATIFPTIAEAKQLLERAHKKLNGYKIKEIVDTKPTNPTSSNIVDCKDLSKRIIFPQNVRVKVYNASEGRCCLCGKFIPYDEFTIDHIIPLAKGGTNHENNLQCCCMECNRMKQDLLQHEFLKRMKDIMKYQIKQKIRKLKRPAK